MKNKLKIYVKSDIMENTFYLSTDNKAISLLKKINKLHINAQKVKAGARPLRRNYRKYYSGTVQYRKDLELYNKSLHYKIKVIITHL